MALVNSAFSFGSLPLPASLGRPTWPMPWPFLKLAFAFSRSKLPSASRSVSAFFCQMHIIWAAFSSIVMRPRRSRTRFSIGKAGFLYGSRLAVFALAERGWPFDHLFNRPEADDRALFINTFSSVSMRETRLKVRSSKFDLLRQKHYGGQEVRNKSESQITKNTPSWIWSRVFVRFEIQVRFVRTEYFSRGNVE